MNRSLPLSRQSIGLIALLVLATTRGVCAADKDKAYAIPGPRRLAVGDRWKATASASQEILRLVKDKEEKETGREEFKNRFDLVGVFEVEAVNELGRWTKLAIEIEKFTFTDRKRKKAAPQIEPGMRVTIDATGKMPVYLEDSAPLHPSVVRLLNEFIDLPSEEPGFEAFAPKGKWKIGQPWEIDKKLLQKSLQVEDQGVKASDVTASAQIKDVVSIGGKTYLDIHQTAAVNVSEPPPMDDGVVLLATFEVTRDVRVPADGDTGPIRDTMTGKMRQVLKGKPGTKDEDTTREGRSVQTYETVTEYLKNVKR